MTMRDIFAPSEYSQGLVHDEESRESYKNSEPVGSRIGLNCIEIGGGGAPYKYIPFFFDHYKVNAWILVFTHE